jgi:hypothetical protein
LILPSQKIGSAIRDLKVKNEWNIQHEMIAQQERGASLGLLTFFLTLASQQSEAFSVES